jgi:predicted acylesterase/phospholipase RssA
MKVELSEVENLVFEGGGAKGLGYPGALAEAEKHGLDLGRIKRVAGASAGAIQALFVAMGFDTREMIRMVMDTDWSIFFDDQWGVVRDVGNVINELGWHQGEVAKRFFEDCVERGLGDHRATFSDLWLDRDVELVVVVCDTSTELPRLMGPYTTPDVPIADAVLASMSLPFVFEPVEIDGCFYVDGGVSLNFPLTCFDEKAGRGPRKPNPKTLGIRADTAEEIDYYRHGVTPKPKPPPSGLWEMAKRVAGAYSKAQDIAHYQSGEGWRTVYIDTGNVGLLDFGLTKAQKAEILQAGRQGMIHFEKNNRLGEQPYLTPEQREEVLSQMPEGPVQQIQLPSEYRRAVVESMKGGN